MRVRRYRWVALVALATGALLAACNSGSNGTSKGAKSTAAHYYLALGDSIAVGYYASTPAQSYVGLIASELRTKIPNLHLTSYACGGATTASMINGPACGATSGSQLGQAELFLLSHRGHVSLVTIDIGFNDIYPCFSPSSIDTSCVNSGINEASTQLPGILKALKHADPGVKIVGMNYYDPYIVYWLVGSPSNARQSLTDFTNLNNVLGQSYAAAGAKMADVAKAFGSTDFTQVVYQGKSEPQNVVNMCDLTRSCSGDPHPNNQGHAVIAGAFIPLLPKT